MFDEITNEIAKATTKLDMGPANETINIPLFLFLKLYEFIGTGFAHPNLKMSKKINPTKSICFIGFKVNLPLFLAVLSPNKYAAYPCENSCIIIASKSPGKRRIKLFANLFHPFQ